MSDRALGQPTKPLKEIRPEVTARAEAHVPSEPVGVNGEGAIAFGGGAVLGKKGREVLEKQDAVQLQPTV